jgi:NADH-quinone oxidoreductase chain G
MPHSKGGGEVSELVTLTIDGIRISVPKGTLLVEAARRAGIDIPVFCYYPKLKPAGACRMCLVEIERIPRLQTACTTPVADGMIVHTTTPQVAEARRAVLEFLLINHPLDCPVCDKGGECPLQDYTFAYGPGDSRFQEPKRRFPKPVPLSDHILLDRERCIMCFRCVRFQEEIAMDPCLTALDRGTWSEIGVAPGRKFDSIFSGNTIELCPVGALTSRHFRFKARPWDLISASSICNQCSVGCNVQIHVREDRVVRILARENPDVDDGWLCDIGRFNYEYLNADHRLKYPEMRANDQFKQVSWGQILLEIAVRLRSILEQHGPESIGILADPTLTNEELYVAQKFARALGTNNICHRLDGFYPGENGLPDVATASIADIARAKSIFLVGADLLAHQPVLDLWVKKAYRLGAEVIYFGPDETDLSRLARHRVFIPKPSLGDAVLGVVKGLLETFGADTHRAHPALEALLDRVQRVEWSLAEKMSGASRTELMTVARALSAGPVAVLYPRRLLAGPGGNVLAAGLMGLLVTAGILDQAGSGFYPLPEAANEQGAIDMGVTPNRLPGHVALDGAGKRSFDEAWNCSIPTSAGLGGTAMLEAARKGSLRGLILLGSQWLSTQLTDPSFFSGLDLLVTVASFPTALDPYSHFRLPLRTFAEKAGTYTNLEGRIQKAEPALVPKGEALDGVEILGQLGRLMGLWGDVLDMDGVLKEIEQLLPSHRGISVKLEPHGARWPSTMAGLLEGYKPVAVPQHWREATEK